MSIIDIPGPQYQPTSPYRFVEREGGLFGKRRWPSPIPDAGAAVSTSMWFCFRRDPAVEVRAAIGGRPERTYRVDYCGAPPAIRCSCGQNAENHDFGDEDPRRP